MTFTDQIFKEYYPGWDRTAAEADWNKVGQYKYDPVQAFFENWNNKPCDADGAYGNQCKDVFTVFNRDVVKAPYVYGNACDLWVNAPNIYYDKIKNTLWNSPRKGDVVIWGPWTGNKFGHVSICSSANVLTFTGFEQNWPMQGYYDKNGNFIGTGVCHFQNHNYLSPKVLGWLRPKVLG